MSESAPALATGDCVSSLVSNYVVSMCRYATALAQTTDSASADELAAALVHISSHFSRTLFLLREVTRAEFVRNKDTPSTILRLNSVASKMGSQVSLCVARCCGVLVGRDSLLQRAVCVCSLVSLVSKLLLADCSVPLTC